MNNYMLKEIFKHIKENNRLEKLKNVINCFYLKFLQKLIASNKKVDLYQ